MKGTSRILGYLKILGSVSVDGNSTKRGGHYTVNGAVSGEGDSTNRGATERFGYCVK